MRETSFEEMHQMPDPYPEQAGANKKSPECENPAEQARISQDRPYRIALCGRSVFLHTIEATLADWA